MDHRNVIPVRLIKDRTAVVEGLFQYDYGQKLLFQDVDLPSSYEVHFSNQEHGTSKTALGDETGVEIPDEFLTTGCPVYFWVFLHDGADDGETEYGGYVDVTRRAKPTNEEPTPVQQDVITQAIATLTDAVEHVDDVAGEIEDIADNIQEEIDSALQEAKDSGEFDGYTPVRGVDYWTEEDKSEFENDLREDGFIQTETDPTVPAWAKQPEKPTYTPVEVGAIAASLKGVANGVAELDNTGKVPASQLPSYVDDIVEGYYYNDRFYVESTHVTEIPGESGKIYVDLTDGSRNIYRWSGSGFAAIPIGLALGETATTAYRGDRGAAAYAAAVTNVETQPHSGSNNLITSGAVYTQMEYKADKANTVLDNTLSMGRKPNTSVGTGSVALGLYETANASYSAAIGYNTTASGQYSSALGHNTTATGQSAHAEGESTTATFEAAHAEGKNTTATGIGAHSEGYQNDAVGMWAHVEGRANQANSAGAHAEGYNTVVSADYAHGEGCYTLATGSYAHASGMYNVQDSYDSWTEWTPNTAYAVGDRIKVTDQTTNSISAYECKIDHISGSSFVYNTTIWRSMQGRMNYAEIIGNGNSSARSNARVLTWEGDERLMGDVYVGCNANSTGGTKLAKVTDIPDVSEKADKTDTVLNTTLSMGRNPSYSIGTNSTGLGNNVVASGNYSFATGYSVKATSNYAYAEGYQTTASAQYTHAEGSWTTASGTSSHSEGASTRAVGSYSHAEGYGASNKGALGKADHAEGYQTTANSGTNGSYYGAHAEGYQTTASSQAAHAEGHSTTASGNISHAEGYNTIASGSYAHAEGYGAKATSTEAHAEGFYTTANGTCAHAEGNYTKAPGGYSHAEGNYTEANANGAHAEGYYSKANGQYSHAAGSYTDAQGYAQFVFGNRNVPSGAEVITVPTLENAEQYDPTKKEYPRGSVVKVGDTIYVAHNLANVKRAAPNYDTVNWHQYTGTVSGDPAYWSTDVLYNPNDIVKVNVNGTDIYYMYHSSNMQYAYIVPGVGPDGSINWHSQVAGSNFTNMYGKYAEIVGNGAMYTAGANIRSLDWDGNQYLKGNVYVECDDDSTGGTKVTPLPAPPVNDGTYILQCSVSSGVATYSWVTLPPASGVSF